IRHLVLEVLPLKILDDVFHLLLWYGDGVDFLSVIVVDAGSIAGNDIRPDFEILDDLQNVRIGSSSGNAHRETILHGAVQGCKAVGGKGMIGSQKSAIQICHK